MECLNTHWEGKVGCLSANSNAPLFPKDISLETWTSGWSVCLQVCVPFYIQDSTHGQQLGFFFLGRINVFMKQIWPICYQPVLWMGNFPCFGTIEA